MDQYLTIAIVSENPSMQRRLAACAAQQDVDGDPSTWSAVNRLTWAASPGWAAAWDTATTNGIVDPGADPAVITDAQILSEVQLLLAAPTAAPSSAWTAPQLADWLSDHGVSITDDALLALTVAELLVMVHDITDTP